jgi:hypothetical protein
MTFPHRPLSLVALLLALPTVGCGYGGRDHHHDYYDDDYEPSNGGSTSQTIEQATIDVDQLLDVEPGDGAGAFIEYEAGGNYHVTTSCDVAENGDCYWDIVVMPLDDSPVANVTPIDLESDDSLSFGAGNQLRLVAVTEDDFDGFSFQTEAGAAIRVDALLDDAPANPYLFWVGDGALRAGAPSNPIDLVPSEE